MNRICNKFIKDTETRLKIKNVEKFNWKILSSGEEFNFNQEVCDLYSALASDLAFQSAFDVEEDRENGIMIDDCMRKLESVCGIEDAYESILKFLFDGVLGCHSHRTNLFFQMFGDIYLRNIKRNLSDCKRCEFCGRRIPFWETDHDCGMKGVCEICGGSFVKKRADQTLCAVCKKAQRKEYIRNKVAEHRLNERLKKG